MDETLEDDVEETSLSEVEETATTSGWAERRLHGKRRGGLPWQGRAVASLSMADSLSLGIQGS